MDAFLAPLLKPLLRLKIGPNALTLTGLALTLPVPWCLARGDWAAGVLWTWAAGLFDVLDGALARASGKGSAFGAFLDSTLDRVSEALVFLGLVLYYGSRGDALGTGLAFTAGSLSQLIPYARARAEGLGKRGEVGWVSRPVRILGLGLGLLLGLPGPTLWILSFLSLVTVLQRIYHVFKQTEPGAAERGRSRSL